MGAPIPTEFRHRLAAVRVAYGEETGRPQLSRDKFAAELGVRAAAYRRYERGELSPTIETLATIRRVTGISLDYLIAEEEDRGVASPDDLLLIFDAPFSQRLAAARALRQISVAHSAEALDVCEEFYRRWEQGHDPMPDIYLDGFAKLTGVSLPFLRHGLRDELPPASLAQLRADHPELWKLVSRARQMPRPRASVVVLPAPPDGEDRQVLQR